jgi:hypothetical protein
MAEASKKLVYDLRSATLIRSLDGKQLVMLDNRHLLKTRACPPGVSVG